MYRCRMCKRLYKNPIKYCECGCSDLFYEASQEETQNTGAKLSEEKLKIISWTIFGSCIFLAILVCFI